MTCSGKTYQADNTTEENGGNAVVNPILSLKPADAAWKKVAGIIQQKYPDWPGSDIQMFIEVMSLDEERYAHYASSLDIPELMGVMEEFFAEQRANDVLRAKQNWEWERLKAYKGIGKQYISEKWQAIATSKIWGRDYHETTRLLWEKYEIEVINDGEPDERRMQEQFSWLLNLLDNHPVLHRMVKEKQVLRRIKFRPVNPSIYDDHPKTCYEDTGRQIIVIGGGLYSADTWVHEIGHAIPVDPQLFGVGRSASSYFPNNFDEDCAEWFEAIAGENDVEGLQKWHPGKFEYILDHVPGLREFLLENGYKIE